MLELHTLPKTSGKKKIRVGRGNSSSGNYSGRGMKGQRARSGGKGGLKLRGLKQTILKLKKNRGFTSMHAKLHGVNIEQLEEKFADGAAVTVQALFEAGLIPKKGTKVKILGNGELKKKLTVTAHRFSKTAVEAITKAGGAIEQIPSTKYVRPKKEKTADKK